VNLPEKKVLYIEDNASNRFLMEMIFTNIEGAKLELALDAEQGLTCVEASEPDLILMDNNLPNMSGLDAVRVLKSDPDHQKIPIIMLTAECSKQLIALAKSAGCIYVEPKPFKIEKLINQIAEVVGLTKPA
jgi:CheY-like chemotaxis protein